MRSPIGEERLLGLIRSAESISTTDDLGRLLQPVAQLLGASATAWFQLESRDGLPCRVKKASLDGSISGVLEPYRGSLFRTDPLYQSPPALPACMSAIMAVPGHAPQIDDYFRDFLAPQGIGDILGVHFPIRSAAGDITYSVSFPRQIGMPIYSEQEAGLLADVVPLLSLAVSKTLLADEVGAMHRVVEQLAQQVHGEECPDYAGLTPREIEIIRLLKAGHSNFSLAQTLSISTRTVENHIRAIYSKRHVSSRTQLLFQIFG